MGEITVNQKIAKRIPTHSLYLWLLLAGLLFLVMLLTMYKDWRLTGEQPNALFYLFVPLVDISATACGMYVAAKIFKQTITFLEILAVSVGVAIVMQMGEILGKLIYYLLWQYPGILWFPFFFGLYFASVIYAFVRWTGMRWWVAFGMAVFGIIASMLIVGIFTSLTGLDTPGS